MYRFTPGGSRRGNISIAVIVALVSILSYCSTREVNPITGRTQYVALSPDQEISLGLQTAPHMAAQFGGLSGNAYSTALVQRVGSILLARSDAGKTQWRFNFYLLADPVTVNAFALPGGQVFITEGLFNRLKTEGQLAGVLAHEIGHVVGRHGAAQVAKQNLTQGLTTAVVAGSGDHASGQIAAMAGNFINLRYGREDELESDALAVRFMTQAGYDPRAMLTVMEVLAAAKNGDETPEFFSTHPNSASRVMRLQAAIRTQFPNGVPDTLSN